MKFTCKTSNLKDAISKVEKIVSKQITLPILSNILISTENGRLTIAATNLEIAIKTFLGAKIEEEGEVTIPARIISGFLANIKEEIISGELNGTELELKSENHKLKVRGMDAKEFPIIPQMPKTIFFKLKSANLARVIGSLLTSVAHNDTRQELNGVYMKLEAESITFASTDSFRLSEVVLPIEKASITDEYKQYIDKNPSIIVPSLTLLELQRVLDGEEVEFCVEQNQLFIKNRDFRIISRLINGNYPEYRQVLPQKYEISISVNRVELIDAVKIAVLVVGTQSGEVKIASSEDKNHLLVMAESIETGDNLSKIPAAIEGPEFSVVFNCRYLSEGLNISTFNSNELVLKLNAQRSPVLIRGKNDKGVEDENVSYVVMPIIKA